MKTLNDNIQPFESITERDLHAYVDGLLDSRRRKKVEAYLDRNPEIAEEVRDYIDYNKLLASGYEDMAEETVPPRLLAVLNRPVQPLWPAVMKAAAVVVLCILSAGAGWVGAYQANTPQGDNTMVENFLQQIALNTDPHYMGAPIETLKVNAGAQTDPLNWLTQKIALEMQAPDLTQAGFSLEGRRLVRRDDKEFVELRYDNQAGETLRLYMKTRWDKQPPDIEFARHQGKSIAHWKEGPLVYALAGTLDRESASKIADLVRQAMSDIPSGAPHVQNNVQILSPGTLTPKNVGQKPQDIYRGAPDSDRPYPAQPNANQSYRGPADKPGSAGLQFVPLDIRKMNVGNGVRQSEH